MESNKGGTGNPRGSMVFPPLESVTSSVLSTSATAYYLDLKPQTLFRWACYESGPITPLRIGKSLRWPVSEIKRLTAAVTIKGGSHA
jgi:hypothetical protein